MLRARLLVRRLRNIPSASSGSNELKYSLPDAQQCNGNESPIFKLIWNGQCDSNRSKYTSSAPCGIERLIVSSSRFDSHISIARLRVTLGSHWRLLNTMERNLSPGIKEPEGLADINPTSLSVSRNLYTVGKGICRDFARLEAVAVCGLMHMASTTSRIRLGDVRFVFAVMVVGPTVPRFKLPLCPDVNVGGCVELPLARCAGVEPVERSARVCPCDARLLRARAGSGFGAKPFGGTPLPPPAGWAFSGAAGPIPRFGVSAADRSYGMRHDLPNEKNLLVWVDMHLHGSLR